jgi:hypothetical protein
MIPENLKKYNWEEIYEINDSHRGKIVLFTGLSSTYEAPRIYVIHSGNKGGAAVGNIIKRNYPTTKIKFEDNHMQKTETSLNIDFGDGQARLFLLDDVDSIVLMLEFGLNVRNF